MIAHVEICRIEFAGVQNYQDAVVTLEFSQIFASAVIVETQYIPVEPDFSSAQSRTASLFQGYFMYRQACQDNTLCLTALDTHFAEVALEDDTAYTWIGF